MWSLGLISMIFALPMARCFPVMTSVTPNGVIVSGGISITVNGTGLTDHQQPKVVVTGTYTHDNGTTVVESFNGLACTNESSTRLECPSPNITLTTFANAGYIEPTDANIRLLNDAKLSFKIGVSWTSYTTLVNTISTNVYKNPSVTMENPRRTYTVWTNRIVNIYGQDLDKYVTDKSQYDISVSDLKCTVTDVTATSVKCLLPTISPTPNDADNKHSLVVMQVGDFTQQLGRIWYRIPIFVDNRATEEIFIPSDDSDTITINGTNLMVAIVEGDVYHIQIGQGECTNIVLSPTDIKCRPPVLQPLPLSTFPQNGNLSQIVVTVPKDAGTAKHQYTVHVGYVKYSDQIVSNNGNSGSGKTTTDNGVTGVDKNSWDFLWKWVLLGIAFFLGLLFLVLLICCVCCYQRLSKNRKGWEKDDRSYFNGHHSHSAHSSFKSHHSYHNDRNASGHSSFRSYKDERNGSSNSSFKTYQTKTTGQTYMSSDNDRQYYITDEKIPPYHQRY